MNCPICGAQTRVTCTRKIGAGPQSQVQRWRRCQDCDWSGSTYEAHQPPRKPRLNGHHTTEQRD